jgi:hypothetical protein
MEKSQRGRIRVEQQLDVEPLRATFRGQVLVPKDVSYDRYRRVWNCGIDRYPSAVLRCSDVTDVVRAVRFLRERNLPFTVRGGGHNVGGLAVADGSVMVDLSAMRQVTVDPQARTVTAQGGATWGEVDPATGAHGLAVTGGHVPSTGVGGLTLGGGIGWLHGRCGLTSDNLLSVELVTADGTSRTVSEDADPDLFWALRGGGGNFGIATTLTFRLHDVDLIFAAYLFFPRSRAAELIEAYDAFVDACPNEATTSLAIIRAPAMEPIPPQLHGQDIVQIFVAYSGPIDNAERVIAPLTALGPVGAALMPMPYTELQASGAEMFPEGLSVYWKSGSLVSLDGCWKMLAEVEPSDATMVALLQMGGKVNELPSDATAFSQRHTRYNVVSLGMWQGPDGTNETEKARAAWQAIQPFVSGSYVNFINQDGDQDVNDAYSTSQQQRLASIKRVYDPDNFFRANVNIAPA